MAVGGGLPVVLFYLSQLRQLETVNWLIRNMVGYVVFAAIVLFQSDIRRALAHLGRAPFFRTSPRARPSTRRSRRSRSPPQMLSSQRTGAIVVVERQIGLRNYVEGGIPLDAQISYDLLVTIFQPGSPLHDGAVIIQENRISAAACFLPLTVNPRLSKDLGTRHRAAIGLTEENDALAVVVSEETGGISLVLDGRIERNITPERPARSGCASCSPRRAAAAAGAAGPRCDDARQALPESRVEGARRSALATLLWGRWPGSARRSARCACRSIPQLPIARDCPASRSARGRARARHQRRARPAARPDLVAVIDSTALAPAGGCSTCSPTMSRCRRASRCCRCRRRRCR